MKTEIVVLVGFGDCAKKHYWPVLMMWAALGRIQLFVIDKFLTRPVELENIPNVTYLQVEKDAESIRTLQVDTVYIAVPDDLHCEIAAQWLGRASAIYIEKPIDRSYEAATRLLMQLSDYPNTQVRVVEHYLSKFPSIYFMENREELLHEIGELKKITTALLEDKEIETGRDISPIILDLGPHTAACANLPTNAVFDENLVIQSVRTARYIGSPIQAETFAAVALFNEDIPVRMFMGKSVGETEKFAEFHGTNGTLILDYVASQVRLQKNGKVDVLMEKSNEAHATFLTLVLEEKIGGITYAEALAGLKLLKALRERVPANIPTYPIGAPLTHILKMAH